MSNNTFRRIFSSVLVQSIETCVLFPSQFARLVLQSKLGHRRRVGSYSVGVVATGVIMGVIKSLTGTMGQMALWL